jgi:hypothetical protein
MGALRNQKKKGTSMPSRPQYGQNTSRMQFRAWLIWQLNQRGAKLAPRPSYKDLQTAVERILLKERA